MICPKCETPLFVNSNFCPNCQQEVSPANQSDTPGQRQTAVYNEIAKEKTERGVSGQSKPPLMKMNVLLLIFISIITGGIFVLIWYLIQRPRLNRLKSLEKLGVFVFILAIAIYTLFLVLIFVSAFSQDSQLSEDLDLISQVIDTFYIILLTIQGFKIRHILYQHFNNHLKRNLYMSGLLIFFMGIFYLQYKINRLDFSDNEKEGTPNFAHDDLRP